MKLGYAHGSGSALRPKAERGAQPLITTNGFRRGIAIAAHQAAEPLRKGPHIRRQSRCARGDIGAAHQAAEPLRKGPHIRRQSRGARGDIGAAHQAAEPLRKGFAQCRGKRFV